MWIINNGLHLMLQAEWQCMYSDAKDKQTKKQLLESFIVFCRLNRRWPFPKKVCLSTLLLMLKNDWMTTSNMLEKDYITTLKMPKKDYHLEKA